MDTGEPGPWYCTERQSAPASVCGEAGENHQVHDQREGTHTPGPWQDLGSSGREGLNDWLGEPVSLNDFV